MLRGRDVECGEGEGKIPRYTEEVHQWWMWYETCGWVEKKEEKIIRVKRFEWPWLKSEKLLWNNSKEEMGIHMTGTGHRELWWNRQLKLWKKWQWGEPFGQCISREIKWCLERGKASEEVWACKWGDGKVEWSNIVGWCWKDKEVGRVFWAGTEFWMKVNINVVGNGQIQVLGELNETAIFV